MSAITHALVLRDQLELADGHGQPVSVVRSVYELRCSACGLVGRLTSDVDSKLLILGPGILESEDLAAIRDAKRTHVCAGVPR